jgi:hypothetical protein
MHETDEPVRHRACNWLHDELVVEIGKMLSAYQTRIGKTRWIIPGIPAIHSLICSELLGEGLRKGLRKGACWMLANNVGVEIRSSSPYMSRLACCLLTSRDFACFVVFVGWLCRRLLPQNIVKNPNSSHSLSPSQSCDPARVRKIRT